MDQLTDNQEFRMKDYQQFPPFASFLPGIGGKSGIPLWVFYVNRGQAIAGFGVEDKDHAIMEFIPADKAYQQVPLSGFRTFIKIDKETVIEPFSVYDQEGRETMTIGTNHIQLESENKEKSVSVKVEYYTLPEAPLAGLIREVTVKNIGTQLLDLEILDGLASIFPSGVGNLAYKELGNTLKSWFDAETVDDAFAFYFLRGSTEDDANVTEVKEGNFYASLVLRNNQSRPIAPIYDRERIFGHDLSMRIPARFQGEPLSQLVKQPQVSTNKVSCGFTPVEATIVPNEEITLYTLIGHASSREIVQAFMAEQFHVEALQSAKKVAQALTNHLTSSVQSKTSYPLFDAYTAQCYLDNGLRGGFPMVFKQKERKKIFYLYSRKHGDLERDYNFFRLSPSYYSQGNGNYRDMNQNRRLDVLFEPEIEDFNIQHFINLIQLDGYNPLAIKEIRYTLQRENLDFAKFKVPQSLRVLLVGKSFTPGDIKKWAEESKWKLPEEFLAEILLNSEEILEAEHGEGFWIDHWTYNLDLLDSFLAVYPDKENALFFEKMYRYFDSPAYVESKKRKFVEKEGTLRQYHAVSIDKEKQQVQQSQWVQGKDGVLETNLYAKLLLLATIKTATIAPFGLGIEMEAGKPGWNDALNGLPGMFGASTSELYELKRLISLLQNVTISETNRVKMPIEVRSLCYGLEKEIKEKIIGEQKAELLYWQEISDLREGYREAIKTEVTGEMFALNGSEGKAYLAILQQRIDCALKSVESFAKEGLVPTYFYFNAEEMDDGINFIPHAVAPFLEGMVKKLKVTESKEDAAAIYEAVRQSDIYDRKLGMYKTSASIANEPIELGRVKSFTPGWLENESIFLHMEYKYLLEMLRKGLIEQFFTDMKQVLVPYLDPAIYGRSILENSSFIVSSANPDSSIHGRGFVARLTGSTVEFLHMWLHMFVGPKPFTYDDGELQFQLQPTLPSWLFTKKNIVTFRLFNRMDVTYVNPNSKNTFGEDGVVPVQYKIFFADGKVCVLTEVRGEIAKGIREGKVERMEVLLG